jgi:hypothetical protein
VVRSRRARSWRARRRAVATMTLAPHALPDPSCRLVFVLAEGLRHIADRRARETGRRGTMLVLSPAALNTESTMHPLRTRGRRRRDRIAS